MTVAERTKQSLPRCDLISRCLLGVRPSRACAICGGRHRSQHIYTHALVNIVIRRRRRWGAEVASWLAAFVHEFDPLLLLWALHCQRYRSLAAHKAAEPSWAHFQQIELVRRRDEWTKFPTSSESFGLKLMCSRAGIMHVCSSTR